MTPKGHCEAQCDRGKLDRSQIDSTIVTRGESTMKQFCCGDIVPGCKATFHGHDEESLFRQISAHASADHGLVEVPPALFAQIRTKIRDVSAVA